MTKQQNHNHNSSDTKENQQPNQSQNPVFGQDYPQQAYYQNQSPNMDPSQFIPLWEQMGASTGGLIGRFIGLNFFAGASYLTNFLAAGPMNSQYNYQYNNQDNNQASTQSVSPENSPSRGYFVTIQTAADNVEAVKNIIKENNGQL